MTYHFRTVVLKVTEVQMLELTPYAGLIVTEGLVVTHIIQYYFICIV